ncbi:breast cancer anti-estrogen resistance protein 1 [Anthonomus grandis grandis]|uniref:breast cancer anti-estrogen resistance protein 1 n=1 Tax=Anthonomus grandis grandis TaxID=2921223 RepID=UPI00216609B0|nr:breast cancer anti-estrogen resistance protein 1 [Anthonomus grandis grandis]
MPQPTTIDVPQSQHCLARALYDNIPDAPDELAFQKGDTLVVLEQNTANIEGWWLCSLRGRQGICPANRLRLIPGVFDSSRVCSPQFFDGHGELTYLQKQGKRRSWQNQPNQVITPKKFNDVYLYDMPPSRLSPIPVPGHSPRDFSSNNDCASYDVPPRAIPVNNLNFQNCPRCSPAPSCVSPISRESGEAYDIPRSHQTGPLTPSSSASSLTADSFSSSNRSSLVNMPDYDVPRSVRVLVPPSHGTYDVPPSHQQQLKELPLELNSALESLEKLESDLLSATSRLLGFVGPCWRTRERLEQTRMEIKLAVTRLRTSLHDLAEFGEGSLGNAAKASDKNLVVKLAPLVSALRKSDNLVQSACEALERHSWAISLLSRCDTEEKQKPDELEQLVACARALTEDVRQIASFIQGNGTLLFKKEISSSEAWHQEDYDYVSLESKDNIAKQHAQILNELPEKLKKGYDNCVKHADDVAFDSVYKGLPHDDKQLLQFFAAQIVTHHTNLTQSIDAFLQTVEHNQPPRIFLAHGKFVVLSAHKLVHIGDTVHRNISNKEIKERALSCANALSDALASSVNKTKQAALQFPLVSAVQEMVDSIVDISHLARDLKVCLVQAAHPLL